MNTPILKNLISHVDDRGVLTELCREDWEEVETKIRQVYAVQNHDKGTIRAFHCHEFLWDYFTIIKGTAKFILFHYQDFLNSGPKAESKIYTLTDKKLQMLVIPPRWMHGYVSLQDEVTLISTASEVYNPENPDCIRIAWDSLGKEIFDVKYM